MVGDAAQVAGPWNGSARAIPGRSDPVSDGIPGDLFVGVTFHKSKRAVALPRAPAVNGKHVCRMHGPKCRGTERVCSWQLAALI